MTEQTGTTAVTKVSSDAECWKQLHSSLGDSVVFEDPKVADVPKLKIPAGGFHSPPVKACTTNGSDEIHDGEAYSSDGDHQSGSEERGYSQWTSEHYHEHTRHLSEIQKAVSNLFGGVEFSRLTGKIANPHREGEVNVVEDMECEEEIQALRRVRRG